MRLLTCRDIDELIILDISATPNNRQPRFEEVKQLTADCYMPVTIGGGIRSVEDVGRLLASGADKVSINSAALQDPHLIERVARRYGSQAVVASIDVRGGEVVLPQPARPDTTRDPVEWAKELENEGAGEILLTSVDLDGTMAGYDLPLVRRVSSAVAIPVIAAGGCGREADCLGVLRSGAHAVAVGAAFQFTDMTPKSVARYLHEQGVAVRLKEILLDELMTMKFPSML